MSILSLAALLLTAAPDRPDLVGRVTAQDVPLAGASVFVYTARPRVGTASLCPSCYPDCGKKTTTGADGSFRIVSLDPGLIFQVLVVADGHRPKFVKAVDPAAGPVTAALKSLDLKGLDAKRIVRGRVLGPDGAPVVGATVEPESFWTEEFRGFSPGIFDPLAVTNLRGEFALTSRSPIREVTVRMKARDHAPRIVHGLVPESGPYALRLTQGAAVAGRMVRAGQPVADAVLGLVQVDRGMGHYLGVLEIGTDREGRFLFSNVGPRDDYFVYAHMTSLKGRGAVPVRRITVGDDGAVVTVGDLAVVAGHRLEGQVLLSDQKPIPPKTRLLVSREQAWDSQTVTLDGEGRFALTDLPTERYSLSVSLKGYRLSGRNKSSNPNNPWSLTGLVDQDIPGLKILLEPGS